MAKDVKDKTPKEPGRIKQLLALYKVTAKEDPIAIVIGVGAFVIISGLGFLVGALTSAGNPAGLFIYGVLGLAIGFLVGLILLSRRAEVVAFNQIEGKAGAVGAVLENGFRGGWITPSQPVAVNPRTKDLVYRVIGPAGIILIGEGNRSSLQTLLNDERRKISKIANGVPTTIVTVGREGNSVPLSKLRTHILKLKRELNRREIRVVDQRLMSMGMSMPIPKGIDPNKLRSSKRPR
ncbi:MAG: hypothetical protein RL556_26 [Actinomycetota bacterium]